MEKIAHLRLYSFFEKNSLLFERQYGFRNKLSTNHALIDITSKIQTACDKGIFAFGVYVDFKKAFDTVNHKLLLNKLNHYGIRGNELQWLKTYLKVRRQHTTVNSSSSKNAYINYGVLQESFLGPLLFLIYINDLNKAIKYSNVHHFADDTNLLLSDKSLKKINKHINHDLKLLNIWLRTNKISLNASKTEITLFRPKSQSNITKHLTFRIRISEVKYLRLILNEFVSWGTYYTLLKKKLNREISLFSTFYFSTSTKNIILLSI